MKPDEKQLPLKGFHADWGENDLGHKMTIEGMGDGRYRIKTAIRQPEGI